MKSTHLSSTHTCSPPRNLVLQGQVDDYQDLATFVHLYGPEPHPALPGTNFDQGVYIPKFWSSVKQHRSYQDRVDMATDILDLIHPSQVRAMTIDSGGELDLFRDRVCVCKNESCSGVLLGTLDVPHPSMGLHR